jgi:hypothetical protein
VDCKYGEVANFLEQVKFQLPGAPDAILRGLIVFADASIYAGKSDLAEVLYSKAQAIARSLGDRASLLAAVENRAMLGLDRLWLEYFTGQMEATNVERLRGQLSGAVAFEKVTHSEVLVIQAPIWEARALALQDKFADALACIVEHLDSVPSIPGTIADTKRILATWLAVKCNDRELLRQYDRASVEVGIDSLDYDDQAVCYRQLSDIEMHVGRSDRAAYLLEMSGQSYRKHVDAIKLLDPISSVELVSAIRNLA